LDGGSDRVGGGGATSKGGGASNVGGSCFSTGAADEALDSAAATAFAEVEDDPRPLGVLALAVRVPPAGANEPPACDKGAADGPVVGVAAAAAAAPAADTIADRAPGGKLRRLARRSTSRSRGAAPAGAAEACADGADDEGAAAVVAEASPVAVAMRSFSASAARSALMAPESIGGMVRRRGAC